MEGNRHEVRALAVSRDGQLIASGGDKGEIIIWHGETGEYLIQVTMADSYAIFSLDFSPDGTTLASGSMDWMTKFWSTATWQMQGNSIESSTWVECIRYSPSGKLLAIITNMDIRIYNSDTRECVAEMDSRHGETLLWTPDGTRLFSVGGISYTIQEWDTSTWKHVGDHWTGHTHLIHDIVINPAGTLIASASSDGHVCLWRLSDRKTIAILRYSAPTCVTFSMDGKHILSGGRDQIISEWTVPEGANSMILIINTAACNACIAGDVSTAEELFTEEINASANYTSYANRSLIMARKRNWDQALNDAIKSVAVHPSLGGYISKGIALCGQGKVRDARIAFDLASMFTNEDSKILHLLILIKAIALFNADQHEEALLLVQQLSTIGQDNDTVGCRVVEAYLSVQLGIKASNDARDDEAAGHFTTAVECTRFISLSEPIDSIYKELVVFFGWDLKSLWQNARQRLCDALRRAGRLKEALEWYHHMVLESDESTKARCVDWSNAFKQECSMLCLTNGNAALAVNDDDTAIELYSIVIELNSASDTAFANRSRAKLAKEQWEDALDDAEEVIKLNPSSHVGYEIKHAALHGAQRFDDAIKAFQMMIVNLNRAANAHIRKLRKEYLSLSEAEGAVRKAIGIQLDTAPLRLFNTTTGLLCDREVQISTFRTSTEYKELLSLIMKHADLRNERITEVVATYFRCVMLSHRWEGKEPLLQDVQDKIVYKMNSLGGIVKLQKFCEIARDAGYHWAWSDTCCIDKSNSVELQESLNSMFVWYHHSALTIVYLSDILSSSLPGALAKSEWITRGWTFQEFVASKVVRFYRKDWNLYLNDDSANHKESAAIMGELEGAMGIDRQTLVAFRPGMSGIRERLRWASSRVTTLQEDVAYSLFGIFGVQLPVIYGEKKQNALGRLLQEIVARSGDITALDWVGQPSQFNSCLPADIISYAAPPCALQSFSEDEIQTAVSSLQNAVSTGLALKTYTLLDSMSAPRFANCRLHLPCIAFHVTEVRRRCGPAREIPYTYGVKADGLHDLMITTKEILNQFSQARPTRQTVLLVLPWDRRLLELPDFTHDTESFGDWSERDSLSHHSRAGSPVEEELVSSETYLRALRLIVRLGQSFSAFLLAHQRGGEYKRIASDYNITAQVKDVVSFQNTMDVRILEIL
jgi:tetratricopeptide (TPR) repeat protein